MLMSFANEATAKAALAVLEQYGYHSTPKGVVIETECPALLAVPAVGKAVGLHQIEKVHIAAVPRAPRSQLLSARA
jgi:hypothetical protein